MLKEFSELIEGAVDEGFNKGVELFVETLENDLNKSNVIEENGLDNIVGELFIEEGIQPTFIDDEILDD